LWWRKESGEVGRYLRRREGGRVIHERAMTGFGGGGWNVVGWKTDGLGG